MNPTILAALLMLIGGSAFAQMMNINPYGAPTPVPMPQNAAAAAANVVGDWETTSRSGHWTKMITFTPDGSFLVAGSSAPNGSWTLRDSNGQIVLTMTWKRWPAESAIMQDGSTFGSQNLKMHRLDEAAAANYLGTPNAPH